MRQAASHARSNDATEEHIEVLDGWDMTLLFVTYLGQSKAARPKKESLDRTLCSCSARTNQINPNISPTLWHEVQRRIGNTNLLTRLAKCLRNTELKPFKTLLIWIAYDFDRAQGLVKLKHNRFQVFNQLCLNWRTKSTLPPALLGKSRNWVHFMAFASRCDTASWLQPHAISGSTCIAWPPHLFSLSLSRARAFSLPLTRYIRVLSVVI